MCKWNFVQIFCIFLLIWVTFSMWGVHKNFESCEFCEDVHSESHTLFTSWCKLILLYFPYLLSDLSEIQFKTSALNAVDHSWFLWKLVSKAHAFLTGLNEITLSPWRSLCPVLQNTPFAFLFHLYFALCLQFEDIVGLLCLSHWCLLYAWNLCIFHL